MKRRVLLAVPWLAYAFLAAVTAALAPGVWFGYGVDLAEIALLFGSPLVIAVGCVLVKPGGWLAAFGLVAWLVASFIVLIALFAAGMGGVPLGVPLVLLAAVCWIASIGIVVVGLGERSSERRPQETLSS
jgi:hypothetical protein